MLQRLVTLSLSADCLQYTQYNNANINGLDSMYVIIILTLDFKKKETLRAQNVSMFEKYHSIRITLLQDLGI